MRKKRAPDSIDVMDKMTAGLTACVSQLTTALSNRPQRQPVQPPTPIHQPPQSRECLSDKIESLYKRRKLAADAGRTPAVARYDEQIEKLESLDEEHTRAQYFNN